MPPPPVPELRNLTRARTIITGNVPGKSSGWRQALIKGQDDPAALAEMAQRRVRSKCPELTHALTGRFTSHHRNTMELYPQRIYAHTADIEALCVRIEEAIAPFHPALELLISIPGFSTTIAEIFIAETEADMTVFPSAGHLSSWAGTSPGSNESAGCH